MTVRIWADELRKAKQPQRRSDAGQPDQELLRIIAMGVNGDEIAKQVSGLLTFGPR
jgi:hypothetical protein